MAASEGEFGMRVGKNYQADIPDFLQTPMSDANLLKAGASLVWSPNPQRFDTKVDLFLEHSTSKYCYTQEQALGMLLWHHHNVDLAISDLPNFAPTPDDWTTEDKIMFEQSFSFVGKNFNKIHAIMPEKPIGNLVKYYYLWKKTKKAVSSIDKNMIQMSQNNDDSKNGSETGSIFQLAQEDVQKNSLTTKRPEYWATYRPRARSRTPYEDLQLDARDLNLIACGHAEHMMKQLENELINCKRKVVGNKQTIGSLKNKLCDGLDQYKITQTQEINPKWTNSELLLAVQGIRHYGKDFQSISEILGTKTEHLVRNFYLNYKTRYGLDSVLLERLKENKLKNVADDKLSSLGTYRWQASSPLIKQNAFQGSESNSNKHPSATQPTKNFHGHKNFLHQPPTLFKHTPTQNLEK